MSENGNIGTEVPNRTIIVNQKIDSNSIGTAGFILSLVAFFICWVPIAGWVLWVLGLLFSLIGVFSKPRGMAVAGLIISCVNFIFLIVFVALITSAFLIGIH